MGKGLPIYTFYLASLFSCAARLKFKTVGANALSWLPGFCLLMVRVQAAGNKLTKGGIGSALGCTTVWPSQHAGMPSIMLGFNGNIACKEVIRSLVSTRT